MKYFRSKNKLLDRKTKVLKELLPNYLEAFLAKIVDR